MVVGYSHYLSLLQEVTPGVRWEKARVVSTIDISKFGVQVECSELSLTSNDFEVSFLSGEVFYKIRMQPNEIASLPRSVNPILSWKHKFSSKFSPQGIAFDSSRKLLLVSYMTSGIGVFKVAQFIPTELPASLCKKFVSVDSKLLADLSSSMCRQGSAFRLFTSLIIDHCLAHRTPRAKHISCPLPTQR